MGQGQIPRLSRLRDADADVEKHPPDILPEAQYGFYFLLVDPSATNFPADMNGVFRLMQSFPTQGAGYMHSRYL